MELVDTMKGVSTHPDKRTGGFYIKFPHAEGPPNPALFGKETRMKIEASKAAAKQAATAEAANVAQAAAKQAAKQAAFQIQLGSLFWLAVAPSPQLVLLESHHQVA